MGDVLEIARERERRPVPVAPEGTKKRIVIVGAGFAGLAAAQALRKCDAEVILIDRRNHHIFQPLLYQVATAVLAPSEIAAPIRELTRKQKNLSVMWAEVKVVDVESRTIDVDCHDAHLRTISFDYLVVATGVQPSYFGHDEFARHAPTLKTISDAELIRTRLLMAFEMAELTDNPGERARQMTFVLVGAGPSGVELAASMAQLATVTLRSNFRKIDPGKTSILLIEGGKRVLPSYAESLSKKATTRLNRLGVKVMTSAIVEKVDEHGVTVAGQLIESATVFWTAGVAPSPIVKMLGGKTDRAGRACVGSFMNLADADGIFVVGDSSSVIQDDRPVPGVAQAAIQQGRYVARYIAAEIGGKSRPLPFRYFDKGSMAVIGKNFAILETGRIRMSGFLAWLAWAFVHMVALPQRQNRMRVRIQWLWSYFTGQRSSRLMSEAQHRGLGI
ncbi:NAD(P)/FAD-dependent oxidoreductase [Bradyrhizobium sp. SSUT18]|uniref:NAD(P)/FAD-dependent oxidoreductase n=1 Tax=Bradyrhizobium sp. SSUT18 TaxID=3040602 RepID=UPI002448BB7B|nr:NAD(P)/FAD-dependent oxidoreductase [Bradyrhizobium sp. SSUT18]MDH2404971.1 NAD(P)/FAD-dependent oxidoreductase [Bradyrhizobium sp. SSUT18]